MADEKKEPIKKQKEATYTYIQYCTIIGASDGVRFVADLKFKNENKKTITRWKEIFKKEGLS
jgi:hypothetical protein